MLDCGSCIIPLGPADDFRMEHMLLQLARPPELDEQLRQFVDDRASQSIGAFTAF